MFECAVLVPVDVAVHQQVPDAAEAVQIKKNGREKREELYILSISEIRKFELNLSFVNGYEISKTHNHIFIDRGSALLIAQWEAWERAYVCSENPTCYKKGRCYGLPSLSPASSKDHLGPAPFWCRTGRARRGSCCRCRAA